MDNHETREIDPVTAFDALYTSNQMQMLKIVLPYMQENLQRLIAIYIKFSELMIALRFANSASAASFPVRKETDISGMLKYLSPYLSDSEREMMNQFSSMQENMEQFKQMSALMQMMNEMGGSPESALEGFLSEEQMAMFKMFGEDLS